MVLTSNKVFCITTIFLDSLEAPSFLAGFINHRLIRNQQVMGSNPIVGSILTGSLRASCLAIEAQAVCRAENCSATFGGKSGCNLRLRLNRPSRAQWDFLHRVVIKTIPLPQRVALRFFQKLAHGLRVLRIGPVLSRRIVQAPPASSRTLYQLLSQGPLLLQKKRKLGIRSKGECPRDQHFNHRMRII